MNPEELLMSDLGEVLREAGGGGEQQPKNTLSFRSPQGASRRGKRRNLIITPITPIRVRLRGHADYHVNQGERYLIPIIAPNKRLSDQSIYGAVALRGQQICIV